MNIIFWNIGEYGKIPCPTFKDKMKIVKELLGQENPDIFCVIEGTKAEYQNKLLIRTLMQKGYSSYYNPSMSKSKKYKNYFEFKKYNSFGLKVFYKEAFQPEIEPLQPAVSLFDGRLVKLINNNNIFIFLHRNRSATNCEQHEFVKQIKHWITFEPDFENKDFFVLGDFNLNIWDDNYYSEQADYIQSSVIQQVHEIRLRENNGLSFYNPIVQVLNSKNVKNLGGTYYNKSKKYKWQILDYILIQKYDPKRISIDIITNINSFKLINSNTGTKDFINHKFDHLPIKIEIL